MRYANKLEIKFENHMKSLLIYDRALADKIHREVVIDDRVKIENMLNCDIIMSDKRVIHVEHDIRSIHIW